MGTGGAVGKSAQSLEKQFVTLLSDYMAHGGEALLIRAYELGRATLDTGWSIPDVIAAYGGAMRTVMSRTTDRGITDAVMRKGTAILAECLSPYEMTHRGYREAVTASRHLNETLENEVKRIAHALHDEAGQLLVAVHLALAQIEADLEPTVRPRIGQVQKLLDQVEQQLRQLSHELRPTVLDDLGWLPAIQFLAEGVSRRARLAVEVRSRFTGRLAPAIETALYRSVQEALNNAARHARARRVQIEVDRDAGMLRCLISDDGVGFDTRVSRGTGLGLKVMKERLNAVNGSLTIRSAPGAGTQIKLLLPVET
jgi:signal transduction histidine kinase